MELIRFGSFNTDEMSEDAVWFVSSIAHAVKVADIQKFVKTNSLETPIEIPRITLSQADSMGNECISAVGKMEYRFDPDSRTLIKFNYYADWVLIEGTWKLKRLFTLSRKALDEHDMAEINRRLDYEQIYNALPVGVISCFSDDLFVVQHMNADMASMLGFASLADFRRGVGESLLGAVHPEDLETFRGFVGSIGNTGTPEPLLIRLRKKDFTYLWVQILGCLAEGQWLVFACIDHSAHKDEIDELVERTEQAHAAHDAYRAIVDYIPAGFHRCTMFPPQHVEFVSDSLCHMTGYSRSEIFEDLDAIYLNLVHPDDRQAILDVLPSLASYPHTERVRYRLLRKDGATVPVTDIIRSVRDADGDMWAYAVVLEDEGYASEVATAKTEALPAPVAADEAADHPRVEIKTFGYFEVLVDGKPIHFRSEKAREMLAVLVDRAGGFVTRGAIIASLWENDGSNKATLGRCRKTYKTLKDELAEYGIDDIIESSNGARRIIPENVKCDLIDYRNGDANAKAKFKGSYMLDYSWAEFTLAELVMDTQRD